MALKVLLGHNYYLQPGGEDTAFSAEVRLLQNRGHEVIEYAEDNQRIQSLSYVALGMQTIWSRPSYERLKRVLERERPDIAHFHNTFPLISPSAYYACRAAGVPVVQSLDNPRLMCPSANFYRAGRLCQECLGKTPPWPSIVHRCYHNSAPQSAVVASMLTIHRALGTWNKMVDIYLVATEFYRQLFINAGIPAGRIRIKPHFVYPDPGVRTRRQQGEYALFVGRLDPEKGLETLLHAWRDVRHVPLKICGEGQLGPWAREFVEGNDLSGVVELMGRLPADGLREVVRHARFLVWPSEGYYETFGYVAVESFSCGVPVIASGTGAPAEVVTDGVTGLHFESGSAEDLVRAVEWAWEHPVEMAHMGRQARLDYEARYTAERNYPLLLKSYGSAIENARRHGHIH